MTDYEAVALAEGFQSGEPQEVQEAWQHLHDTRLGYRLQGWFGRTLIDLLEAGKVTP